MRRAAVSAVLPSSFLWESSDTSLLCTRGTMYGSGTCGEYRRIQVYRAKVMIQMNCSCTGGVCIAVSVPSDRNCFKLEAQDGHIFNRVNDVCVFREAFARKYELQTWDIYRRVTVAENNCQQR